MPPSKPPARPVAKRHWVQRILLGAGVLATVLCLVAAAGVGYVYAQFGRLVRFDESQVSVDESAAGEPENFLIVGSDSRDNVDPNDPAFADVLPGVVAGERSDTIIIARIDPADTQIQLMSLPRDLFLPISGTDRRARINEAYGRGRQVLIDTIRENFGIRIHHYVEVDFVGFQDMVNALGGVPLYLDTTYRDRASGLPPVGPGCVTLDGEQALEFARARHLEFQVDGRWQTDPTGDLGRITRQQFLIRKALERVLSLNLTDVLTFNRLLDVGLSSVGVDGGLSNDDLRNLAARFRSFDPAAMQTLSLPVEPFRTSAGAAVLGIQEREAQRVLNVFRGLPADAVRQDDVVVHIQNGSGVTRQASNAAEALSAVEFVTEVLGDASEPFADTTVYYPTGSERAAQIVARHLTSRAVFVVDDDLGPNEVILVTGADFTTVVRRPWSQEAVPLPVPPTTDTAGAATQPTPPPAPATTIVGALPEAPPPGVTC